MFGYTYLQLVWYFLIYSFLGWCLEVVYCSIVDKKVVNRGFLNGPVCPIYGFGLLFILFMLKMAGYDDVTTTGLPLLFFGGVILSTLVELIGGWALLKLFHTRWWDYRMRKYNYKGFICLQFSIAWGIGAVFVVKVLHNTISSIVETPLIENITAYVIVSILSILFVFDLISTVFVVVGLNKRLQELDVYANKMRMVSDELSEKLGSKALDVNEKVLETTKTSTAKAMFMQERLEYAKESMSNRAEDLVTSILDKTTVDDKIMYAIDKYQAKLVDIKEKCLSGLLNPQRLIKAFPNMSHVDYNDALNELKNYIKDRSVK